MIFLDIFCQVFYDIIRWKYFLWLKNFPSLCLLFFFRLQFLSVLFFSAGRFIINLVTVVISELLFFFVKKIYIFKKNYMPDSQTVSIIKFNRSNKLKGTFRDIFVQVSITLLKISCGWKNFLVDDGMSSNHP